MADKTESQSKWFTMTPEAVGSELQVDPAKGLGASEAQQRLQKFGPNQLEEKKKEPGWQAFLRQYQDLMQLVLLGAAIINQIFTGEWGTTLVLVGLTIFNAVLALRGEAKAEASLSALAGTMKAITRVRRDGEAKEIEAKELVPGDVVLMEAGDLVPADGRLFVTATLEIEHPGFRRPAQLVLDIQPRLGRQHRRRVAELRDDRVLALGYRYVADSQTRRIVVSNRCHTGSIGD